MGLSAAYLEMIWEEVERLQAWDCGAHDLLCTLAGCHPNI